MQGEWNNWMQLLFRWIHLIAGILWIGHLWFFNFVNAHLAKTYDAESKKKVVPELMPRALYWFRWGAAWTWISGVLLLGLVYYMGGVLFEDPTAGGNAMMWLGIFVGFLVVGFLLYNAVMKAVKNIVVANIILLVVLAGIYYVLDEFGGYGGRSLYIHVGGLLGTMMAANVWMVIWPAQKKIIAATKNGEAPDAALVAKAGLRSRHNTYMSIPLLFTMISNHYPTVYGSSLHGAYLAILFAIAFLATWLLFQKSAKVAGM
jgi:uncharacterized membrane protein